MLWVRTLDSANGRARLPGTEGARRPFWSPDSRSIGFFVSSEIRAHRRRGGPARRSRPRLPRPPRHGDPDGTILLLADRRARAASRRRQRRQRRAVATAAAPIRPAIAIRSSCRAGADSCSSWVGRTAFAGVYPRVRSIRPEATRLGRLGRAGRVRRARLAAVRAPGHALGPARSIRQARRLDGEPVAVADDVTFEPDRRHGGVHGLGQRCGRLPQRARRRSRSSAGSIAPGDRSASSARPSRSASSTRASRRTAAARDRAVLFECQTDLWVLDAAPAACDSRTRRTARTRRLPVWSPRRRRASRISRYDPGASRSRRSRPPAMAQTTCSTRRRETKMPCDWSPDGRFLVYYVPTPKTGTDLWVLPLGQPRAAGLPLDRGERVVGPVVAGRALDGLPVERDRTIRDLRTGRSHPAVNRYRCRRRRCLSAMVARRPRDSISSRQTPR